MSDSWILIAMTILIVFLLFYMSKRLICSGPILTNSNEELGENERIDWSSASHSHGHYCDGEMAGTGTGHSTDYYSNHHNIMTICHPTNNNNINNINNNNNNNNFEEKTLDMGNSHMENRLRLQVLITHMILAEKEHKKLELEVTRLARLLAVDQGGNCPEECVRNLRNELFPLNAFGNFQSQRLTPQQQRLLSTFPSTFSFISELTSPTKPTNFDIIDELANNNHCSCRCGGGGRASSNNINRSESSPQSNQKEDETPEEQENHNYSMTSEHNRSRVLCANDNDNDSGNDNDNENDNDNDNESEANACLNSDTVTNQIDKSENNNYNNHNNNKSSRTKNINVTNNTLKDNSIGYENNHTAPSTPQNSRNRQIEHELDNSSGQKY